MPVNEKETHPETAALAKAARARTGMTQRAFADLIWSRQRSIVDWEQGRVPPTPVVQLLLHEIAEGFVPKARPRPAR